MFDDRHFRALGHGTDQAFAPSRHAQVHVLREGQQDWNGFAVRHRHNLHGVFGECCQCLFPGFNHHPRDRPIRVHGLLAASQNRGVAGLETKAGGVRGDVGAGLVDDDDHADGGADFLELQPIGPDPFVEDFSDRIRQGGHCAQTPGNCQNAFVVELEPVQHRGREP